MGLCFHPGETLGFLFRASHPKPAIERAFSFKAHTMFCIALSPTYSHKIKVTIPTEKAIAQSSEFTAIYKRCSSEEIDVLREKPGREVVAEVLVGFVGLVDDNKEPVEFDEVTKAALLSIPQAQHACILGFWESVSGGKQKN
jgi:hypothetical protein